MFLKSSLGTVFYNSCTIRHLNFRRRISNSVSLSVKVSIISQYFFLFVEILILPLFTSSISLVDLLLAPSLDATLPTLAAQFSTVIKYRINAVDTFIVQKLLPAGYYVSSHSHWKRARKGELLEFQGSLKRCLETQSIEDHNVAIVLIPVVSTRQMHNSNCSNHPCHTLVP